MHIAHLNDESIFAHRAERGADYRCPECGEEVILRRGTEKAPHFAHKPDSSCSYGAVESVEHQTAQLRLLEHFDAQGLGVHAEVDLRFLQVNRRADLVVQLPTDNFVVIELQRTPILSPELARRSRDYMARNLPVLWLPLKFVALENARRVGNRTVVDQYPAQHFEKWIHAFHFGELWQYDTGNGKLWRGKLEQCQMAQEFRTFESEFGGVVSAARRVANRRWRKLTLEGPFDLTDVRLTVRHRQHKVYGEFELPGGPIGRLELV